MELILATRNKHKIKEIKDILKSLPVKIYSMLDFKTAPKIKEDGRTFRQNAVKKAKAFSRFFSLPAVADDSGLEVKALGGAPGVRSARFAGPGSIKRKLCAKVLKLMEGVPPSKRGARFVCIIAIALPGSKVKIVEGVVRGRIAMEMRGRYGFGYDPIFIPKGYRKTFAQMKPQMKNRLSHRAEALNKVKQFLRGHR